MTEFDKEAEPFEYLFWAFNRLSKYGMRPKVILVHVLKDFREWLKILEPIEDVFGVEIKQHKEIPDEVILLVAARPSDPDTVALSLKLNMVTQQRK
jgi:hypothetical protein